MVHSYTAQDAQRETSQRNVSSTIGVTEVKTEVLLCEVSKPRETWMHGHVRYLHRGMGTRATGHRETGTGRQGATEKRQKNGSANWELELALGKKNRFGSRAARAERGGAQIL